MSKINNVKLMAEYECFPLWSIDADNPGSIEPEQVPISERLIQDLWAWASRYDKTLNWDDPVSSDFKSESEKQQFKEDGEKLYRRLQEELGEDVNVTYRVKPSS